MFYYEICRIFAGRRKTHSLYRECNIISLIYCDLHLKCKIKIKFWTKGIYYEICLEKLFYGMWLKLSNFLDFYMTWFLKLYVLFLFHKFNVKMLLETLSYASTPEPNIFQFYYTYIYIFDYEGQTKQIKKTRIYLRRREIYIFFK